MQAKPKKATIQRELSSRLIWSLSLLSIITHPTLCDRDAKKACPLLTKSIFEPRGEIGNIIHYTPSAYGSICSHIGDKAKAGGQMTCCSKEEFKSLQIRWNSTKDPIYAGRIRRWAGIVDLFSKREDLSSADLGDRKKEEIKDGRPEKKSIPSVQEEFVGRIDLGEGQNQAIEAFKGHFQKILSNPIVKLDCVLAAKQVKSYFYDIEHITKKTSLETMNKEWHENAKKCLLFTFKAKIGSFCAICDAETYKWMGDSKIKIVGSQCTDFLNACDGFIRSQMEFKEYLTALAALSKCDHRGWTKFDQPFLYKESDPAKKKLLDKRDKNKGDSETNKKLCELEYSLSTMLKSDLSSWKEFASMVESVVKRYDLTPSPEELVQPIRTAGDPHSSKQDLGDMQIEVWDDKNKKSSLAFSKYYEGSGFEPSVTEERIKKLVDGAWRMSLTLTLCLLGLYY